MCELMSAQLMQEITYLEPDKIRASGLTEAEMKNISAVSNKHMMSMVRRVSSCRSYHGLFYGLFVRSSSLTSIIQPPATFLAYTVLITPKYSQFPPAPGFVKSFLVPYVFTWSTKKYFQFAPKL